MYKDTHLELVRWASARLGAPFEWGRTDCVLLCLEALDVVTGAAYAREWRGRWRSRFAALRAQALLGFDFEGWLCDHGALPIQHGLQRAGDLLLVRSGPFACGHVCLGGRMLSAEEGGAVVSVPLLPSVLAMMTVLRVGRG